MVMSMFDQLVGALDGRAGLILGALSLASMALAVAVDGAKANPRVVEFTLGNGLQVLVIPDHCDRPIEDVVKAASPTPWCQLYIFPDRGITREKAQRAEAAGCKVMFVTVDGMAAGARNFMMRPPFGPVATPGVLRTGADTSLSWKDIAWLRSFVRIPIVGLSTTQKKIDKEPDEIVRMLRGQRSAILFLQSQREVGVGLLEKLLKLDRAAAEKFYTIYRDQYNPDLTVPDSVVEEWVAVGTFRAKEKITVKPQVVYDWTFAERARR